MLQEWTVCSMADVMHVLHPPQDPRFERIPCSHKGTYADDCLCQRVSAHRCYIVATCDRDLRRRLRKVTGRSFDVVGAK
jgi:hypothetical protein